MSTMIKPLESLQEVLQPIGSLQAENEEMAAWIHDSFAALEKLHEELTQWQSELVRKETELDLREDANRKLPPTDEELKQRVLDLDSQLSTAQADLALFEAESSEQLNEFEALEARYAELEARFEEAAARIAELEAKLAEANARNESAAAGNSSEEEESRRLNAVLEEQIKLLTAKLQELQIEAAEENPSAAAGVHSKSAELRQRALSRRAARQPRD